MTGISLEPIGTVRSAITSRKDMPALGAPAAIEVLPQFAAGLWRMEKHSHLWVLAWLDTASRDSLQVTPRGVRDTGPEGLHGVFAVRSPSRPNPIGLTAARILSVVENRIELDRLDFTDGTPVLDLKPYFPTRDMIFCAANAQVGRSAGVEAVRESLYMQAMHFCGEASAELDLAVSILTRFRTEVLDYADPAWWKITVPADRPKLADAFMGMARVSLGRGSLLLHPHATVICECDAGRREYDAR